MNDLVAKRYVKALLDGRDSFAISTIGDKLNTISLAFADERFNSIISSPQIASDAKINLISSFTDSIDNTLSNLIRLLGEKRRLNLLASI